MKKWTFRGKSLKLDRPLIMGILNISPESFSGDVNNSPFERAMELIEQGSDIIDIGACSTAPNNPLVSEEEELERLIPVVKQLTNKINIPLSVDTFRPSVARTVAQLGADIINDVGGVINPDTARVVREFDCGWVITHSDTIDDNNPASQVFARLQTMAKQAIEFGVPESNLCVDIGIGFNKENSVSGNLIKNTELFSKLPYPLLVGLSRKRIIGELSGISEPKNRDIPSLAANIYCAQNGADIIRVHNVDITFKSFNTLFNLERY